MVEDVCVQVEVVEALWGQHHAHIIAPIKQRHRLQEKVLAADLCACQSMLLIGPNTHKDLCAAEALYRIRAMNMKETRQVRA